MTKEHGYFRFCCYQALISTMIIMATSSFYSNKTHVHQTALTYQRYGLPFR